MHRGPGAEGGGREHAPGPGPGRAGYAPLRRPGRSGCARVRRPSPLGGGDGLPLRAGPPFLLGGPPGGGGQALPRPRAQQPAGGHRGHPGSGGQVPRRAAAGGPGALRRRGPGPPRRGGRGRRPHDLSPELRRCARLRRRRAHHLQPLLHAGVLLAARGGLVATGGRSGGGRRPGQRRCPGLCQAQVRRLPARQRHGGGIAGRQRSPRPGGCLAPAGTPQHHPLPGVALSDRRHGAAEG
ncbi:hypothetical protein HRbin24_02165 [bacterium HR24]|nr:hypothetical protein HRbin24_02165 [bacterium HR24]